MLALVSMQLGNWVIVNVMMRSVKLVSDEGIAGEGEASGSGDKSRAVVAESPPGGTAPALATPTATPRSVPNSATVGGATDSASDSPVDLEV
ncbi:hypothetical protein L1987_32984 [Smallanthus sonchifolius]|uniref:Uncharacterized protein n=1 Tax=Smallanthus sonchifolius TaxID=185202 RepID=A0ACB9HQG9_9ASTR|nr:hypothetical protein L1987_32984 [Smallanthus sonchifolius]